MRPARILRVMVNLPSEDKLVIRSSCQTAFLRTIALAWAIAFVAGCHYGQHPGPTPLGTHVDEVMRLQEENAEASKYVVYTHEFEANDEDDTTGQTGWKLNAYGEDHVKQIAVNLKRGDAFPVVVERSATSVAEDSEFGYPIHFNDALDAKRRQVVVAALQALGVPDADERVIVAPAFAEGYTGVEASRAYNDATISRRQGFGFGFGFGSSRAGIR